MTALYAASRAGSIAMVEMLVTKGGADVNWTLSDGSHFVLGGEEHWFGRLTSQSTGGGCGRMGYGVLEWRKMATITLGRSKIGAKLSHGE